MGNIATVFQRLRVCTTTDSAGPTGHAAAANMLSQGFAPGPGSVATNGYTAVEFKVVVSGTTPSFTIQPLHHDESDDTWMKDTSEAKTFNAAGTYIWEVPARGRAIFPQVTAVSGTDTPTAVISYSLKRTRNFV